MALGIDIGPLRDEMMRLNQKLSMMVELLDKINNTEIEIKTVLKEKLK